MVLPNGFPPCFSKQNRSLTVLALRGGHGSGRNELLVAEKLYHILSDPTYITFVVQLFPVFSMFVWVFIDFRIETTGDCWELLRRETKRIQRAAECHGLGKPVWYLSDPSK